LKEAGIEFGNGTPAQDKESQEKNSERKKKKN